MFYFPIHDINLISRKPNHATEEVFNDPPTNCRDLSVIGYTLNGYYPVQSMLNEEQKSSKIGMIYCKFNANTRTSLAIGILNIRSCMNLSI